MPTPCQTRNRPQVGDRPVFGSGDCTLIRSRDCPVFRPHAIAVSTRADRKTGLSPSARRAGLVAIALVCLLAILSPIPASAAERWKPFLEGLRERGLHDMAMVYLDRMAADPNCPADLRAVLDYEAGITLMTGSRASPLTALREQALEDARGRFEKFLAEHPDHDLALLAGSQLANVLVERGRIRADRADSASILPEQKEKLLAEARGFYTQAHTAFAQARDRLAAALKKLPDAGDTPGAATSSNRAATVRERGTTADAMAGPLPHGRGSERAGRDPEGDGRGSEEGTGEDPLVRQRQLEGDLLRTRLFLATAVYEIGMTYPAGNPERKAKLTEAAAAYHAVYKELAADRPEPARAGLFARLWEGRCYRELGEDKKALDIFNELLESLGDAPGAREVATPTLVQTLETLVKPKVHQYTAAIEAYERWAKGLRGDEESSPDALSIKCLAGEAYLRQAATLKKADGDRSKMLKTARRLLRSASRIPGAHQADAKAKLLDPLLGDSGQSSDEPADFAAARDRAEAARDRMEAAELGGPSDVLSDKKPDATARAEQVDRARDEAIRYYRLALSLATRETPIDELNLVRRNLAYLHWTRHDPYDAAVLGEFVARRHSEAAVARQAATIALVAYAELYNTSPTGPAKQFARQRMMAMAEYITERWPTGPEASDAWITLIHAAAVAEGNLDAALGYLAKLPADSSRRGEAEVLVGRVYWSRWADALRRDEGNRPDAKTIDGLLAEAQRLLASGIKRMAAEGQIDTSLVAAVHALAQIYLQQNQPAEAVKLLDDPTVGAMTLVRANHPAVAAKGYDVEICKTALRAYVAARQLDKAEAVMDTLEKRVAAAGDAQAAGRLTEIYLGLSRQLQDSLELLRAQQRNDEVAAAARGFETFLNRIADRKAGNTFASLAWVASTFADMGDRFDAGGRKLAPEAKKFYQRSLDVYDAILERCEKQPQFAPGEPAIDSVKVRSAHLLRRLGRYGEALRRLVDVLARRNRMVDAQIEAAYTYQDWATAGSVPDKYLDAIRGAVPARRKDGSRLNVVWGWGKLSSMILRSRSRPEAFHEARYNLALCRYEYAMTLANAAKKEMLAAAEKDITVTQLLNPALGGDARRRDYDLLMKKIQNAQGREPVGLPATKSSPRPLKTP